MNQTILVAVLTLVLAPLLVALLNNLILRLGKKDDITLQRETLLLQKEAALEQKREKLAADVERAFTELESEYKGVVDDRDARDAFWQSLGTSWPEMRALAAAPGALLVLRANRARVLALADVPPAPALSSPALPAPHDGGGPA